MILRKELVVLVFVLIITNSHAQNWGFEWIKPYQSYYKFKIGSAATYRIGFNALQQAGIASVNPKRIQLFYQGVEVPIYIAGEADNQFNAADFIEFYGNKNDGFIDSFLYQNRTWQPNTFNGLFTDTAVYYLTILPDTTVIAPLRYVNAIDYNFSGLQPEAYFMDTAYVAPAETYLDGPDLINASEKYISSEYESGEGWASDRISWFNARTFVLKTPFPYLLGPQAKIEFKVIGASNARLNGQLVYPNHHFQLSISNNNSSFNLIADQKYNGYDVIKGEQSLNPNALGSPETYVKLTAVNDLGMPSDFSSLSYALITYPRQYQFNGGSQRWLKVIHEKGTLKSFIQISGVGNGSQTNAYALDITSLKRIPALFNNATASFIIENDGRPHQVWVFDSTKVSNVNALQQVVFPQINPSTNYSYLIIGHQALEPALTNYAQYRSTKHNVLKVKTDELYDYYFYGNRHPYAIRRLMEHLINVQTEQPKYLLLAGRGYQNDKARFNSISSPTFFENYNNNLVPGYGVPGADALFSSGIKGDGFYAEVPTGRVPASTSQELQNYLNKVSYYETSPDSIQAWRKRAIHVSGGTTLNEQLSFKTTLTNNAQVLTNGLTGTSLKSYNKSSNLPTQVDLRDKIIADQNGGVNLVSFLGHASLTILDVDMGGINDLNNTNKYPFYYFSGCNVGNATEVDPTTGGAVYAKEYICAANKGAIGWLAHSNFAFDGFLPPIIGGFYRNYAQQMYGSSIGEIVKQVCKELSNTNPITKNHNLQWVLQGDPAVKLYSPQEADFAVTPSDFFITNSNLSSQDQYLDIGVIVNNLAKAVNDSINVSITRRLPNNQTINYPIQRIKAPLYQDTVLLRVETLGDLALGNNLFEIKLDVNNEVVEITENNNTTTANLFVPGNGSMLISPSMDAVVGNDTVWLIAQNNNILSANNEFLIEVDQVATFNSPQKNSFGPIQSGALLRFPFLPKTTDTTTYYWRAKLNLSDQQGGRWNTGVFTYIPGHPNAWMQRTFDRKTDLASTEFLRVDTPKQRIDFTENSKAIKVSTNLFAHGGRGVFFEGENQNPGNLGCVGGNGFSAIIIDSRTLKMTINPRFGLNCANVIANNQDPSKRKLFYYAFPNSPTGHNEFVRFVDSLNPGTYVAVFSQYNSGSPNWPIALRNAFAKLGSAKVANGNSQNLAFAMVGIVGAAVGTITEDTTTEVIDNSAKEIEIESVLVGNWFTCSAISKPIGPAKSWERLDYLLKSDENDGNDINKVNVYGVSSTGTDTILLENVTNQADLSTINATKFPYIKLGYTLFDTVYRTPDQLQYWIVKYKSVPEGTISIADSFRFYNTELEQGDSLKLYVTFKNISAETFDSVPVLLKVIDASRNVQYEWSQQLSGLKPNELIKVAKNISTYNFSGLYSLELYFNDGPQLEQTKLNNYLFKSFKVNADRVNPLLDVTFDGYRIVNGDFVSPTPLIRISSKDDSKFKLQNDTSMFTIMLREPGKDFERVSMSHSSILFKPAADASNKAIIDYSPSLTTDGRYTLKVINKDASGNTSGNDFYEVDFEVQKKSTITNFFPYPNPATTNVKFVFTLTGSAPPDQLLIRIMTVSGRVVKEITKDEFGPIKIGQNISEYSWDGTDNYGDRLANGVYLYQVLTKLNGSTIERRKLDKADAFFVQDVGKIYLMK